MERTPEPVPPLVKDRLHATYRAIEPETQPMNMNTQTFAGARAIRARTRE